MKNIILFGFIGLFSLIGCTKSSVKPIPQSEPQEVIVNHSNPYLYMGGITLFLTSDSAYSNRTLSRSYYRDIPIVSKDLILYQNSINSQRVNGNNKWVSITKDQGNSWVTIQLGNNGVILNVK